MRFERRWFGWIAGAGMLVGSVAVAFAIAGGEAGVRAQQGGQKIVLPGLAADSASGAGSGAQPTATSPTASPTDSPSPTTTTFPPFVGELPPPPTIANADAYSTLIDTLLAVPAPGVLGNDLGLPPVVASVVTPPTRGTLALNPDGSFTYIPFPGVTGVDTFVYRAASGPRTADATVTITVNQPPAISGVPPSPANVGTPYSHTFTVAGFPPPALALTGNPLPPGIALAGDQLVGIPTTAGTFPGITVTASNGILPDASITFTIVVTEGPLFTSADNLTLVTGSAAGLPFQVSAIGTPAPAIDLTGGALPTGVTWNNALDQLQGLPGANTGGVYNLMFTAANGVPPDAVQAFTLTVNEAPSISGAPPAGQVGVPYSFTFTVTGFPAPVLTLTSGTLPPGLSISGNSIVGTPTTAGLYGALQVTASNVTGSASVGLFSIQVNQPPQFTSADNLTVVAGSGANLPFTVTAFGTPVPNIDQTGGALPAGVAWNNALDQLQGAPNAGTGGVYPLQFTAANGILPDAVQAFTLTVNEPPTANPDAYTTGQGIALNVPTPGVLVNDDGFPPPTVTPIVGGATTQGGSVTLNPDGSFTYTPPGGFQGADTFTYTITNGIPPDATATVTVNVDAPPSVTLTSPANGATDLATTTNVDITFSEAVNAGGTAFSLECPVGVPQAFATSGGPAAFTLNPTGDLPSGTTCTVTVAATQVSDQDAIDPPDNMAADYVFSFTTDAAPAVTTTVPTNLVTGVGTQANITVNFSELVNVTGTAFTLNCAGAIAVTNTTGAGPASSFVLDPNVDLPVNTLCTVTVAALQVSDNDANDPPNLMAAGYVFSFTTDKAPAVFTVVPADLATQIAANTNITVTFDEPVNVTATAFTLNCAGAIALTNTTASPATSFVLDPNVDLPNGAVCTVTVVATQVTDDDTGDPPNAMTADFTSTFTIDAAPSVMSIIPADGGGGAVDTDITITFSENVVVTASAFTLECPAGTPFPFVNMTASPATVFTLNPAGNLPAGTVCTVTVVATEVNDQDAGDPPSGLAANFVSTFTATATPPIAIDDAPAGNSVPGGPFHTDFETTFNLAAPGLLANDTLGNPVATLTSFGGGTIGGSVTTNAAGATAVSDGHSLTVNANGSVTYVPKTGFTGNFTFDYRISNAGGIDDGNVIIAAGDRANAMNDTYTTNVATTVFGNVKIDTNQSSEFSVLANDPAAGGDNIVLAGGACTLGGSLMLNTVAGPDRGKFVYDPPRGVTGAESCAYSVTNGFGTVMANVGITVANVAWFVDASFGGGGDGRLSMPYNSLTAFNGVNNGTGANPNTNHAIFIYENAAAYNGGVVLLNGQKLFGQDATITTAALLGDANPDSLLPATNSANGTKAIIENTAASGVVVQLNGAGGSNTLRGFTTGNAGVSGDGTDIKGTTFGTLTVSEVDVTLSGTALSLATGTVAAGSSFISLTSTGATGKGVDLNTVAGTFATATTSLTNPSGTGVDIAAGTGSFTFGNTTVNKSTLASTGMSVVNQSGTQTFSDLDITTSSGSGLVTSGGVTLNATSGTIASTGGPAINATNTTFAATFDSVSSTASPATGINLDTANGSLVMNAGSVSGPAGNAVGINAGGGTITYAGSVSKTSAGRVVEVTGRTAGTITLGGTLTCNSGCTGINVANSTGGSSNFSGATKTVNTGANAAVTLATNTGHTINFTGGGLDVDTTSGMGFTATGGGTVTVQGAVNTIMSTTGTALNVANTTIGASGLTFQSISANGALNGIVLNATGSSGGLSVTGTGGAGTGGTIQNATGPGISLTSASAISLSSMNVSNGSDDGIRGSSVTGLSLNGVQVTTNGNAVTEAGIDLSNLFGTSTWTGITVSGSAEDNVVIRNSSGTLNSLAVTGSTFDNNSSIGNDGFLMEASGTAAMTVSVTGSTFSANRGDHFQAAAANSGILDVVFSGNTLSGGHISALGQGITVSAATGVPGYAGTVDYNVDNNTINGAILSAITVNLGTSANTANMRGTISGNTIGTIGLFQSGSTQASGITVESHGNGTHTTHITNNTIRQTFDRGINTLANDGNGTFSMTVTGNSASHSDGVNSREGFFLNNGSADPNIFGLPDSHSVCLNLGGAGALKNTLTHGPGAPDDFRLRQRFNSTIRLPGYGGAAGDTAAVVLFVNGNNTSLTGSATVNFPAGGGGFVGGAACPLPP